MICRGDSRAAGDAIAMVGFGRNGGGCGGGLLEGVGTGVDAATETGGERL